MSTSSTPTALGRQSFSVFANPIGPAVRPFVAAAIALASMWLATAAQAQSDVWLLDWPNWRGPQQNCISAETGLVAEWDPAGGAGSNLLWKSAELAGRSTPIVLGNRLYTIVRDEPGTVTEGEKVVCVDVATGDILWEHRFNVYLSDVPDTRVGWSSCVGDPETGRVYALGVCGYFCCLEGDTGEVVWSRSLHEEYGLLSTYGGRTNVPVIYEDTVIVSAVVIGWGDTPEWGLMAKPAHRFMAMDKATGELRWLKGTRLIPDDTTYSTPTVAHLPGLQMDALVFASGDGQVWALQAGTGLPIWNYPFSRRGINISPWVAPDGTVYVGQSEENLSGNTMGSAVALQGDWVEQAAEPVPTVGPDGVRKAREIWRKFEVMAGKSSPVVYQGRAYFVDDRAKMFIYDALTGEQIRRQALGTVMRSTPLFADGKIYCCTNNGRWWTLEPNARGVRVLQRMRLNGEASDGSPIVSRGRIFVPTSEYLYCIGEPDHKPQLDPEIVAAAEAQREALAASTADTDREPAHLQIVPWDTLLKPGERQQYRVRLYNKHGDYLRDAAPGDIQFSVATGPGNFDSQGTYSAPNDAAHECALVSCTLGELTGTARVRVVPPLPWSFDFDAADDVPLTWVGGRVRHILTTVGDNRAIVRPTELPTRPGQPTTKLGTRSRMWMGPVDLADYTMTADVMLPIGEGTSASAEDEPLPEFPSNLPPGASKQADIGLINSRYTLALYGASQEVRLYSWCTHDKRTQATLPFEIDPQTWYTLKLRVEPRVDEVIVQGKAWPRGEAEPRDWTLEVVDPAPNLNGSPGLFGNAKDAEVFVDNITVTPNN